jgi:hypothetical protein
VAQQALTVIYESAPAADGPWTRVDPGQVQVNPDGSASVAGNGTSFYRLRVISAGQSSSIPVLTLAQVPEEVVAGAKKHLQDFPSVDSESNDEWSDAELAPFATALSDTMGGGASYYEFKIIAKPKERSTSGFRKFSSDDNNFEPRGYIIFSANSSDVPVPEFATEGSTPVEVLLRKCGATAPARIIRYGAGFWVAENAQGELVANHGTEPFKIPATFGEELSEYNNGIIDSEAGRYDRPPATKAVKGGYPSYAAFKSDFETNAFYRLLRKRRGEHARADWNAERGVYPTVLKVNVGETATFLKTTLIERLIVDDELTFRNPADVIIVPAGGIRVSGRFSGRTMIKVRTGERVTPYMVEVVAEEAVKPPLSGAAISEPYWKVTTEEYAGSWSDQMRYYQLRDSDWCDLVGCGPTAIAMLLGWWEHKNSVESAFYSSINSFDSLKEVDSPMDMNSSTKRAAVRGAYRALHEFCDVICDPFSDAGATWPSDMPEGWNNYLFPVANEAGIGTIAFGAGTPLVGYSASWAYDSWGDDWDQSGSIVAVGIKNDRPGIIGLGTLWHYGVAYGYKRKDLMFSSGGVEYPLGNVRRYLKVNEGWNRNYASWYSAYEVFLGMSANMWQRKSPQRP